MKTKRKRLYASHGGVTHPMGQPCADCDQVEKEFAEALKSGEVDRFIKAIGPTHKEPQDAKTVA